MPLKLAVGVKRSVPSASRVTVPPATAIEPLTAILAPLICVTVSGSLSISLSFVRTSMMMDVSSGVVKVSSTATGASLTGVTVPRTVASAVVVPSDTV